MSKVTSALTYQKGAWVLHMLRNLLGDIAFRKGIRSYYQKYFNGNATTSDFRNEMEIASGQNLQNFFAQWLYQPGMPHINGKWSWDSKKRELKITLTQTQTQSFSFNLEIGVATSGSDSIDIKNVNVNSSQSTFTFPVATKPLSVTFDPRTTLLGVFEISQQ
jgi:aminopeptidase N